MKTSYVPQVQGTCPFSKAAKAKKMLKTDTVLNFETAYLSTLLYTKNFTVIITKNHYCVNSSSTSFTIEFQD